MTYAANGYVLWPVPPDWADGIQESLEWLTDHLRARNGRAQKRELRQAPRRTLEFPVIADEQLRRVADAILNDHGAKYFEVPIWHDVQLLSAPLLTGATSIPCEPAGRDFVAGGRAVLWSDINSWLIVDVDTIEANAITLASTILSGWPSGTRLYPVRRAHLVEQPEESIWTDCAGKRSVQFQFDEPCEWPAVLPSATYRGYPVLEMRPDESEDPSSMFRRDIETIDVGTGVVTLIDWPQRPFHEISVRWMAFGRTEYAALRSLIYALRGRMQTLWIPTWTADLKLTADIGSSATTLSVEWAGYTVFGRMQSHRRDIRIELNSGAVYYRRITAAAEAGSTETLGIDSALGVAITRGQVRAISFLVLAEQTADRIDIEHVTDIEGVTAVATRFVGVRHDV